MVLRLVFYVLLLVLGGAFVLYATHKWPGLGGFAGVRDKPVVEHAAAVSQDPRATIRSDIAVSPEVCGEARRTFKADAAAGEGGLSGESSRAEIEAELMRIVGTVASGRQTRTHLTCLLHDKPSKSHGRR
jgi:hypothetical protein